MSFIHLFLLGFTHHDCESIVELARIVQLTIALQLVLLKVFIFLLKLSKRIISKFHYLLILESLSERFFRIFRRFLIFRRGETFASVFPGFIKTKEASLPREEEQPAKYIYCIIILF